MQITLAAGLCALVHAGGKVEQKSGIKGGGGHVSLEISFLESRSSSFCHCDVLFMRERTK